MTARTSDFEQLYLSEKSSLIRRVARRLGSHALAADLVHDVFLRLWEKGHQALEDEVSYVGRSVSNAIVDHARAERVRKSYVDGILPEQYMAPVPTPHEIAEVRDEVRMLDNWLQRLPERTRHIFLLNKVHGCKYAEIANVFGISRSAVEKHIARAMVAWQGSREFVSMRDG